MPKRAALLSVTDKTGIVDLAHKITAKGLDIIASSGTAAVLATEGISVIEAGEYAGTSELLGGRVKTLHPKIFAGILARRNRQEDLDELEQLDAYLIELVVCNLYELKEDEFADLDPESVDIGGHAMIRAAAKNADFVAVATDREDFELLLEACPSETDFDEGIDERRRLAGKAWQYAAEYDDVIVAIRENSRTEDAKHIKPFLKLHSEMRYGENPHQEAQWWTFAGDLQSNHGLHGAEILFGKGLSYNNVFDIVAAVGLAEDLGEHSVAVIKHQSPCGAASLGNVTESLKAAIDADRMSAYGGVIAIAGIVDVDAVESLKGMFVDVLVAWGFTKDAKEKLATRKKATVLQWPNPDFGSREFKGIPGGVLIQARDSAKVASDEELTEQNVTSRKLNENEIRDLRFAEIVAKHAKSNAVIVAKGQITLGIGSGQVNRADASKIAVEKAGEELAGAVLASDGFFPFADGLRQAKGIVAVIQPGGSIRDPEVIDEAENLGISMVLTGKRHFRH